MRFYTTPAKGSMKMCPGPPPGAHRQACPATYLPLRSEIAAWAAARRAIGTRNGEQDT